MQTLCSDEAATPPPCDECLAPCRPKKRVWSMPRNPLVCFFRIPARVELGRRNLSRSEAHCESSGCSITKTHQVDGKMQLHWNGHRHQKKQKIGLGFEAAYSRPGIHACKSRSFHLSLHDHGVHQQRSPLQLRWYRFCIGVQWRDWRRRRKARSVTVFYNISELFSLTF